MQMTEYEICCRWQRMIKDRIPTPIQVLADLNGCSEEHIKEILISGGVMEAPKKRGRKIITEAEKVIKEVEAVEQAIADEPKELTVAVLSEEEQDTIASCLKLLTDKTDRILLAKFEEVARHKRVMAELELELKKAVEQGNNIAELLARC